MTSIYGLHPAIVISICIMVAFNLLVWCTYRDGGLRDRLQAWVEKKVREFFEKRK